MGEAFPWAPPPVEDLGSPDGINEEVSLCLMADGCSKEVRDAAMAALTPIAEASKAAGTEMLFYAASSGEGAVGQIRKLTKLGDTPSEKPQLLMIDIPSDGAFYVAEPADVSAESINAFIDAFKRGSLERQQLG